jgi:hypothetical protein
MGKVGTGWSRTVSLFALARQRRRHFMAVKKELEDAGVEPAMDPKKVGASFYRRDQVGNFEFQKGIAR